MKLVRFALLTVTPAIPEDRCWQFKYGEVLLSTARINSPDKETRFLVAANISLDKTPSRGSDGAIVVSGPQRVAAEEAIEIFANVIAFSMHARRQISSPIPWLGLVPETPEDGELLAESPGLALGGRSLLQFPHSLDPESLEAHLLDRLDGLALVAEALSSHHASGAFREVLRLFERGFALAGGQLVKPLAEFLEPAGLGYTHGEVKTWIDRVRHPLTHADRRTDFLLEKDVRPFAGRAMQAAYDVLLNKLAWRAPGTERRSVWEPECGTLNPKEDCFITQGCGAQFRYEVLDDALVFPIAFNGVLKELPKGVWAPLAGAETGISVASGPLLVKEAKSQGAENPECSE